VAWFRVKVVLTKRNDEAAAKTKARRSSQRVEDLVVAWSTQVFKGFTSKRKQSFRGEGEGKAESATCIARCIDYLSSTGERA
jgi:hypothetical protein